MKLCDLDMDIKKVLLWARIVARDPCDSTIKSLQNAVREHDDVRAPEMLENIMHFVQACDANLDDEEDDTK